jgi:hypothetical protein
MCLLCETQQAERDLDRAESFMKECEEKSLRVGVAKEKLDAAANRATRLQAAVKEVYGGFGT